MEVPLCVAGSRAGESVKGPTPRSRFRPRSKFNAVRTTVHGWTFDSKKEAQRYGELLLLGRAGRIRNLELQPWFHLHVNGERIGKYVADFRYQELDAFGERDVIEDVKGMKTPVYRLKKKLVEATYGIRITEV